MVNDVLPKKRFEAAPDLTELRLRAQLGAAGIVAWSCPPSGLVVEPHPDWIAFTGQTAKEMLGDGWTKAVHPEDLAAAAAAWREAVERGKLFANEHRIRHHDGQWRWMSARAVAIRDESGEIVEWCGVNIDITERKRAENALRESEERLRRVSDNAEVGLTRCSRDWIYLSANPAYAKIAGKPLDQIIGRPIAEVMGAEAAETIRPYVERVLRGEHVIYEARVPFDGAGQRYLHVSYTPDTDAAGDIVGWVACVTDITERRAAEEALRVADRRKNEFLAMLGHELRNPLAPIKNGLHILNSPDVDAAIAARVREIMTRQADHLARLVDDLLNIARISQGRIELRKETVNLAEVVNDAVAATQPLMDDHLHRLTISLPSEPIALDADPTRLAQALTNLLNNAAKFTDPGGRIEISVTRDDGEAAVSVKDNGVGIPADKLECVFDLFTQIDSNLGHSRGGLGIGLALVRRLVEMLDGRVEVHSEGIGRGSEFIVRLPLISSSVAVLPEGGAIGSADSRNVLS